ncbi:hypothetical protein DPMN_124972 [Dreissena polymorpha]|uniref:Uncharacterized protein n=1 Tax=Dreissena polymorpha TaxID=45954 RepID=A0A9D4JWP8_DREPO|nr:hypothetical protein DPMN_124972 [Dreissena polymorpha]
MNINSYVLSTLSRARAGVLSLHEGHLYGDAEEVIVLLTRSHLDWPLLRLNQPSP